MNNFRVLFVTFRKLVIIQLLVYNLMDHQSTFRGLLLRFAYYRLQTKLQEGTVFTGFRLSTGEGLCPGGGGSLFWWGLCRGSSVLGGGGGLCGEGGGKVFCNRDPSRTSTAAGGSHPTGMLSCVFPELNTS